MAQKMSRQAGTKNYEITNHLGNVMTNVSDRKIHTPTTSGHTLAVSDPDIRSTQDYYPYGMPMKGRTLSEAEAYRYGFQGQERDDEMKGAWNSINYAYRMHDPRVGRFFAVDPLYFLFPYNSQYAFSENRLIDAYEIEGLENSKGSWKEQNSIHASDLKKYGQYNRDWGYGESASIRTENEKTVQKWCPDCGGLNNEGQYVWITENAVRNLRNIDMVILTPKLPKAEIKDELARPTQLFKPETKEKTKTKEVLGETEKDIVAETKEENEPHPTIKDFDLNLPFVANRSKFSDKSSADQILFRVLQFLKENPKNTFEFQVTTMYDINVDILDAYGLLGDSDTSNELVKNRSMTVLKWFIKHGVNRSQLKPIINRNNFSAPDHKVKGVLTIH